MENSTLPHFCPKPRLLLLLFAGENTNSAREEKYGVEPLRQVIRNRFRLRLQPPPDIPMSLCSSSCTFLFHSLQYIRVIFIPFHLIAGPRSLRYSSHHLFFP